MKTKNGFTLIELLVVVAILGILAAVGLGQFYTAQKRGRDAQRKENLASVAKALEMYYNDYERYPQGENGKIKIGANSIEWGNEFSDDKGTVYMKQLPKDPADNFQYFYRPKDEGATYTLYANLEHSEDQDISDPPYGGTDCQTDNGNQFCNYCIASPNESCD